MSLFASDKAEQEFLEHFTKAMRRAIGKVLLDAERREDAVQDALLEYSRQRHTLYARFTSPPELFRYLAGICRHKAVDVLRDTLGRDGSRQTVSMDAEDDGQANEGALVADLPSNRPEARVDSGRCLAWLIVELRAQAAESGHDRSDLAFFMIVRGDTRTTGDALPDRLADTLDDNLLARPGGLTLLARQTIGTTAYRQAQVRAVRGDRTLLRRVQEAFLKAAEQRSAKDAVVGEEIRPESLALAETLTALWPQLHAGRSAPRQPSPDELARRYQCVKDRIVDVIDKTFDRRLDDKLIRHFYGPKAYVEAKRSPAEHEKLRRTMQKRQSRILKRIRDKCVLHCGSNDCI